MVKRLKNIYQKGYLIKVINPAGKLKPVYIAETLKGYTAKYSGSMREIRTVKNKPEAFARLLARKGHKSVTIRD